jgi:hypothetical protein
MRRRQIPQIAGVDYLAHILVIAANAARIHKIR